VGALRRAAWVLVLVLVAAGAARAQSLRMVRGQGDEPVEIRADRIEARLDGARREVVAVGRVLVTWGGYRLRARRVRYLPAEDRAEAEGEVVFTDPDGNRLECEGLEIHLDTQKGVVRSGRLWIAREGYRVWGKRFERLGERSYRVEDGGFTACDGTWPSWRVEADRVEVELEGLVRARGASFWMEGVPVAYSPVLVFPVVRERRSGFLLPRVGWTDTQGLRWLQRYYWAPSDSWDLTPRAEYRSRRGWTEGIEFRYAPAEGHRGRVDLEHLYDRQDRGHRYAVELDHESRFPGRNRLRLQGAYQGDTRYQEELADTLDDREARRLRSFGLWSWDGAAGTAYGLAEFFQALDTSQASVLQTLPRLGFLGREVRIAGPLVGGVSAEAARFWRARGPRGERVSLEPAVGLEGRVGGVGTFARAGLRENLYRLDGRTRGRGAPRAEVGANAFLWRRYGTWLHTLEPFAGLEAEGRGHGEVPAAFDGTDRFDRGLRAVGGVSTRWIPGGTADEVLGADLRVTRDLTDGLWGVGWVEAFWAPAAGRRLWAEGEYEPETGSWASWAAGGRWAADPRTRGVVEVRHRQDEATYLDAGLSVALGRYGRIGYRGRADLDAGRLLEDAYSVGVAHPCWELDLTYSRTWIPDEGRLDRKVFVMVNLKGLGTLGTWKGILP